MNKKYEIQWDEAFASGIKEIDDQHKDVIRAVNELYAVCEKNENSGVIINLIEQLDNYTTIHFDTEENYAKKYGFEKINELLSAHKFFKQIYNEIKNYYTVHNFGNNVNTPEYKYTRMFAMHLNQTLIEWLYSHLYTIDKELFDYLKEKI